MRINSVRVAILGVALLLSLPLAAADQALFWQLERGGEPVGYLLGTIHSDDERVNRLSPAVAQALGESRRLLLELDFGDPAAAGLAAQMFAGPGEGLAELLSPELYARSLRALQAHGIPEMLAARMRPWAAVMTLSVPPPSSGLFLDLVLYQRAVEQGLSVHGLESMQEQLAVFSDLPLDEQLALLEQTLEQLPLLSQQMEALIAAYQRRDLEALVAITEAELAQGDDRLGERLMVRLIDERNARMFERLAPYLADGGLFIAVGALHLPGESGLLAQLRAAGYRVRPGE